MVASDLLKIIERTMLQNNEIFFSCVWREKLNEFLSVESKYSKLVEWINRQIDFNKESLIVFNPADHTKNEGYYGNYIDCCKEIGILLNTKWIILDNRCTTQMRERIEQFLMDTYSISFNKYLNEYITNIN